MKIPDQAVEAARAAYWSYPMKRAINNSDEAFRAALEAAAPHLMAQAWDEGKGIGQSGGWNKPNPYRSVGAGE